MPIDDSEKSATLSRDRTQTLIETILLDMRALNMSKTQIEKFLGFLQIIYESAMVIQGYLAIMQDKNLNWPESFQGKESLQEIQTVTSNIGELMTLLEKKRELIVPYFY